MFRFLARANKRKDDNSKNVSIQLADVIFVTNKLDKSFFIKAMSHGVKIGYLNLTRYDGVNAKLADIVIFDNYRGAGIGSALMREAINIASSSGIEKIWGAMEGDTERLNRFYLSFGFEILEKDISLNIKTCIRLK